MKYPSTLRVCFSFLLILSFGLFGNSPLIAQSSDLDNNTQVVEMPENSRMEPSAIFRIESSLTGPSDFFDYLDLNFPSSISLEQVSPGLFHIYGLTISNNFTFDFNGNGPVLLGVTSIDIAMIQRHILGSITLDPDKIIAADVTGDGRVSAVDLIDLRKVILGKTPEFASKANWKFIPATVNIMYTGTTIDLGTIKAIKVGNVN